MMPSRRPFARPQWALMLGLYALPAACKAPEPPPAEAEQTSASSPASEAPVAVQSEPAAAQAVAASAPSAPKARPEAKWTGPMPWLSWDEASERAAKEQKRILLVLYADWCPRCRELSPVFAQPDMVEAAEGVLMVRQNVDERPAWLSRYAMLGTYVPRLFFLEPDGSVISDLTSGHPKYPYFYSAHQANLLKKQLREAATR